MGFLGSEPEKPTPDALGVQTPVPQNGSLADGLRAKAAALRGPRGVYRCRKCKQLPCICPDPKKATATPVQKAPATPMALRPELFTEASTKRLLEAGFGIPVLLTHCRLWALTDEEALELAKPAALVLNEFVAVDPKWVALTILSVSLGGVVARKAVLYTAWKRAMQVEALKDKKPNTPQAPPEGNEPVDDGSPNPGPGIKSVKMFQ